MDINAYRLFQDSGWIREMRGVVDDGERAPCPVEGCDGTLASFDVEAPTGHPTGEGVRLPGGVYCVSCGARSRPVVL